MKPVKMVAWFTENGMPTPIKFQMKDDNKELVTIKVDNVSERNEEKLAGNRMLFIIHFLPYQRHKDTTIAIKKVSFNVLLDYGIELSLIIAHRLLLQRYLKIRLNIDKFILYN